MKTLRSAINPTVCAVSVALTCLAMGWGAFAQPILPMSAPMATLDDTNESPVLATAILSWTGHTNALLYRWTNWNAATNQGGWTTATNTTINLTLGTNTSGVRAEAWTNISPWATITNRATATNAVGITGIETRTMPHNGATWGPWVTTTQTWYDTSQFQKQWRPQMVHSNWWRLDLL